MLADLRYALRQLRTAPGFALVAIASLALGIGANAAIFSVANALLLRPLRPAAGALVRIYRNHHSPLTYAELRRVADATPTAFREVVGERMIALARTDGAEPEKLTGAIVAGDYFGALAVRPAVGRLFTGADTTGDAESLVVLSHAYWRDRLAMDPAIVGRVLRINGHAFTVVGVAEPGFTSSVLPWRPEVFFPVAASRPLTGSDPRSWGGSLYVTARLREGVDRAHADALLRVVASRIAASDTAAYGNRQFTLRTDHARGVNAELRLPVAAGSGLLSGVVGLVLLIACANVANLLLARATTRSREVSMRLSLGASRARLVRQLLTESVVLAALGGVAGLGAAYVVTRALADAIMRRVPEPVLLDLSPDGAVVAYTVGLGVVTALLFGLVPALQASRPSLVSALKDGGGGAVGRRSRLRSTLVGAQVALCTVLIAVASLLVHSLANARDMDPGFDPRGLVDVAIDLGPRQLGEAGNDAFFARLVEEARAIPGVRSAALAALVPLAGSNMEMRAWATGATPGPGPDGSYTTYFNVVTPGYFETLGLPVVRGRALTADDEDGAAGAVVVNETVARRLWPNADAVGQRVSFDGPTGPWRTVVGVARNAKYNSLGEREPFFVYLPEAQMHRAEMVLQVRGSGASTASLQRTLRGLTTRLDPLLPPPTVTTAEQDMRLSMLPAQMGAALTSVFGSLALLLAAVGIYGVVAYAVARRTREIGVRAALGAGRVRLVRLLMLEAGRSVTVGLVVGLALALGMGRALASILYDVGVVDPISLVVTPLVLGGAAALAAYVPARRATRISPVVALRQD